jgi:hypothetical protein
LPFLGEKRENEHLPKPLEVELPDEEDHDEEMQQKVHEDEDMQEAQPVPEEEA